MTTNRKKMANRANAQRSTGPKTPAGKRLVSRNATRHGLTSVLDVSQVTKWYRIILGVPDIVPSPLPRSDRERAAFHLAEAQARLERVWQAEDLAWQDLKMDLDEEVFFGGLPKQVTQSLDKDLWGLIRSARHRDGKSRTSRQIALRLLIRYRRDAEAQRHRALRHWIRLRSATFETKPNSP